MPEGTATLAPGWVKALSEIFKFYTPIVIGYGGNDGSLMDFLSALEPPITGGIFWCHRIGSEPEEKVKAVVAKHLGRLVPVVGFDELMLQLQQRLKLPDLSSETESRTADRLAAYRKQIETLLAKIHEPGKDSAAEIAKRPVREAATIATERIAMATTERIAMAMSNPIFSHLCGITLLNEYIYQDKYFRREMYFLKDNGFIQPKSPNNSLEFWDELDGKNLAEVAEPTDLGRLTVKLRTKDIPPELLEDKNNLRVYPSDL